VKKGKSHTQEILQLLDTLKLMIRNLAENIAKRWKFQMFARIVLKTLHRSNRHDVRMSAFESLLMLMDIFGWRLFRFEVVSSELFLFKAMIPTTTFRALRFLPLPRQSICHLSLGKERRL
jgi:hypothetical protein